MLLRFFKYPPFGKTSDVCGLFRAVIICENRDNGTADGSEEVLHVRKFVQFHADPALVKSRLFRADHTGVEKNHEVIESGERTICVEDRYAIEDRVQPVRAARVAMCDRDVA